MTTVVDGILLSWEEAETLAKWFFDNNPSEESSTATHWIMFDIDVDVVQHKGEVRDSLH